MPADIVEKLNRTAIAAMDTTDLRKELVKGAYKVIGGSPRDFEALIKKDAVAMGNVVRTARITLEK
jgi:tripartite-type tricarboxylate transporter receptor subunit TctC